MLSPSIIPYETGSTVAENKITLETKYSNNITTPDAHEIWTLIYTKTAWLSEAALRSVHSCRRLHLLSHNQQ